MSVCIVSFSSRKSGNCAQISDLICSIYPDAKRFDFSDFTITGCGNCSYQCFEGADKCPHAHDKEREILDAITNSQLTFFVVPNYCDYPCSNYFVFNERSLCYFQGNESLLKKYLCAPKKFIVVSNSNKDNFGLAFCYQSIDVPEILYLSSNEYGKKSIDADLLSSDTVVEKLKQFILKNRQ